MADDIRTLSPDELAFAKDVVTPRIVAAVGTAVHAQDADLAAAIEDAQVQAVHIAMEQGISLEDGEAIRALKELALQQVLSDFGR